MRKVEGQSILAGKPLSEQLQQKRVDLRPMSAESAIDLLEILPALHDILSIQSGRSAKAAIIMAGAQPTS